MTNKMSARGGSASGGKKVILFGTFDIIHKGHLNLFWQARRAGDFLVVVVARDETVSKVKNKSPLNDERTRARVIKDAMLADEVVLGSLKDKYSAIKKYQPEIIALGYDQNYLTDDLKIKLEELKIKTKIVRLKSYKPEIYKTSKLNASKK